MESWPSDIIGALALVAAFAVSLTGCLKTDYNRRCGEDHPPCYKQEVCHQGRCTRAETSPPARIPRREAT